MTIDVEDYFHVAAFNNIIKPEDWHNYPSRVIANTEKILEIFERQAINGTFFVLGWVASKYPELVKLISNQGHEIASHGYSHQLIYKQTPEAFHSETARSKEVLESITGKPVHGYRAASYSITRNSLWAIDILLELGFKWDSSIFPVHHDNYGIPGTPSSPYYLSNSIGSKLLEIPLTTASFGNINIPAAGGGYFRLYPYLLSSYLFKRATRKNPGVFYLHPWEIDPEQPKIKNASFFSKFRHYNNLNICQHRLNRLLSDFNFSTISELISQLNTDAIESIDLKTL